MLMAVIRTSVLRYFIFELVDTVANCAHLSCAIHGANGTEHML
jgi:hypothetical protein